jgi:predicted RNA binding protein YcfA (HicA-like mRNA interferase family)
VRDVIRLIEEDGWVRVQMRGDHRQYKHPMKRGRVTIAGHPSDDVHAKTLQSILTQAGLRRRNP